MERKSWIVYIWFIILSLIAVYNFMHNYGNDSSLFQQGKVLEEQKQKDIDSERERKELFQRIANLEGQVKVLREQSKNTP